MAWRRASFKGRKVWVEVDDAGVPRVDGGRVAVRYSDAAGATVYRAGASRVGPPDGPAMDLADGVDADDRPAAAKPASRGSGFGSAGTRTAAQAARAAEAAGALLASLPAGTAVAFTDGGCRGNPGPAGSGVALTLPDGRRAEASVSVGVATNNVAELTAVGVALTLLDEAGVSPEAPVAVLTDSQYVQGVLSLGWKAKANKALIEDVRAALAKRPGVRLHWVAGHVGTGGNERADALAGRGVEGITRTTWFPAP